MLARYNDALPNGAERIVAMAETQSKHRQQLELQVINANCKSQQSGQWLGFIISMTAILGGVYLIHDGKSGEGLAAIIAALAGLTTVFVVGRIKQQKQLHEKADALNSLAQIPHK
jgi:uncharacterized membrane protein